MRDMPPLQLLGLRWVLLTAVHATVGVGATEQMCLDAAQAAYPQAGSERVRAELEYLESHDLVTLRRSEIRPWHATITGRGRDVAEYVAPSPDGIARPPRATPAD